MRDVIKKEFEDHIFTSQATIDSICSQIEVAAKICINSLQDGGKILIFGNGGDDKYSFFNLEKEVNLFSFIIFIRLI